MLFVARSTVLATVDAMNVALRLLMIARLRNFGLETPILNRMQLERWLRSVRLLASCTAIVFDVVHYLSI